MESNGDEVTAFNSNQYEVFREDVKAERCLKYKSEKWKYLVCALFINMVLSCPVYVYGMFLVEHPSIIDVWPPILFNSVYLMLTPQFFNSNSLIHRLSDRAAITIGVIITSIGITINGLVLTSYEPYYLIGTLFYGGLGGIGTCLTMAKVWHILDHKYQMENLRWINAVYSTGQSMSQFIFPYIHNSFINAYGHQSAIIIMGSMILNALPLCLIISHTTDDFSQENFFKKKSENTSDRYNDVHGYFVNLEIDIENDIKDNCGNETLATQSWQNPGKHFDFIDGKMINSFGVEIMDIIEEENEEDFDRLSISSVLAQHVEIVMIPKNSGRFEKIKRWLLFQYNCLTDLFYQNVIHPTHRAFMATNFLPLVFLKSSDICTYVLCVTVMPHLAITQYGLDSNEIPFLISSLAFPWLVVAVSTPFKFKSFSENQKQIFVLSGLLKIVGLFFILISTSKVILTFSSTLIGFTQGTSFLLQDEVIRSAFSKTEWKYLRSSLYIFTGLLLLFFGIIFWLTVSGFVGCLALSLVFYVISFVCWISVPHIRNVWLSFRNTENE